MTVGARRRGLARRMPRIRSGTPGLGAGRPERLDALVTELVLRVRRPLILGSAGAMAALVVIGVWLSLSAVAAMHRENRLIEAVDMTGAREAAVLDESGPAAAVVRMTTLVDLPQAPPGVTLVAFYVRNDLLGAAVHALPAAAVAPSVRADVERFPRRTSHDAAGISLFFARAYGGGRTVSQPRGWVERAYVSGHAALTSRGGLVYVALPILLRGQKLGVLVAATRGVLGSGQAAWLRYFRPLLRVIWTDFGLEITLALALLLLVYLLAGRLIVQPVRHAAWRDPLSRCYNQVAFWRLLESEVARGDGEPLSLVVLDCDHFKAVNDAFGHERGDAVLASLGAFLRAAAEGPGVPGRLGGEEFALIWRGPALAAAAAAERVRTALATADLLSGHRLTVSAGVAAAVPGGSARALVEAADRALYTAKQAGRDRVVVDGAPDPRGSRAGVPGPSPSAGG